MSNDAPEEVLLAHAWRQWDAEVENAKRHSARMTGVLTLISAILGVGLFNLDNLARLPMSPGVFVLRWMLAMALVHLFGAVRTGLRGRGDNAQRSASLILGWTNADLPNNANPFDLSRSEAIQISCAHVLAATEALQEQNLMNGYRIDAVQSWLCWSGFHAGLGALGFLLQPRIE